MTDGPNHISTASSALAETIALLAYALESTNPQRPNEVKTCSIENALSMSILLHSVVLLEGWLHRLRFFQHRREARRLGRLRPMEWLRGKIPEDLRLDLNEVFCARDVIVHGHLWEARVAGSGEGLRFVEPPALGGEWFGDRRFWEEVLDPATRQSRRLHLNLYPVRIWRRDAYLSFHCVVDALVELERYDPTGFRIETNWGLLDFGDKDDDCVSLCELARRLEVPPNV